MTDTKPVTMRKKSKPKKWTKREIAYLRKHYGRKSLRDIAAKLGRSYLSVKAAAFRLGISDRPRFWTDAERQFVVDNYSTMTAEQIAAKLGKSLHGVYGTARRLGLMRSCVTFGKPFEEFLNRRHAEGWTDAEIARGWGCDRHTVGQIRSRLGLSCNQWSQRQRDRVSLATARQVQKAGLKSLADVRVKSHRDSARAAGWPEDLRPRAVQILNALWSCGPLTRREIADAIGMPWKGPTKSLVSNDPEGSYLAHLAKRGLVIVLKRARRVTGHGPGKSVDVYSLPLDIQRGPIRKKQDDCTQPAGHNR